MGNKVFRGVMILTIAVVLGGLLGTIGVSAAKEGRPILIGAPVPRASAYGQNGERGMILAAEEINAAGGVNVGGVMRPF